MTPPTEAELAYVHDLVEQAVAELRASRIRRERMTAGLRVAPRPLPDVTLKGERLRESRRARGLNVPDAA